MLCGSPDGMQLICNADGTFTPQLPTRNCAIPIKATVEKAANDACTHSLYRVGYRVSNNEFLELYRSCYDEKKIQVHYVSYDAYYNTLGDTRPDQTFTSDRIISSAAGASFEAKNYYKLFEALLGPHQTYVNSERHLVIHRGHLVPSAGFGFEQHKKMTFKYINAVPQFGDINYGNWKRIETWILTVLSGRPNGFTICVGALEVLKLNNTVLQPTEVYLYDNNKNPIPKWLFKTVTGDGGEHYAFLTYNNIYEPQKPTPNCQEVTCPSSLLFNPAKESGFSFCCDYNDFINRNVPHLISECN
ncbi:uncharacterized protein LOC117791273 [Drosophila innubila]|uniref:uncharacterized protein LOC117791273 n=1 Tax=Drosophila innubila TaxID=198719 RepID=UPI00148D839A|nr:uncharacterized protein LOC117791273 [Drosophila innubila]